jgi:hypothetical protein
MYHPFPLPHDAIPPEKKGGHILSFIRQGPDHTKQATVEERNHHREDEHKASNIEPRLPSPVSESMFNPA